MSNQHSPSDSDTVFLPTTPGVPHEPPHKYSLSGTYMITAATLYKQHLFNTSEKLSLLQNLIFEEANKHGWSLKAWAVFSNHYHLIVNCQENPESLPGFIRAVHAASALKINRLDHLEGRRVWYKYWDTHLTLSIETHILHAFIM